MLSIAGYAQGQGWMTQTGAHGMVGTTGKSLRLEGFQLTPAGAKGVEYRAHVENIGWQDWKQDGATAGLPNSGRRTEALAIRLTADLAESYDIYYRVHVQDVGWMGWAKNGGYAGTSGEAKRIEALEYQLVSKNQQVNLPAGDFSQAFREKNPLRVQAHIQNVGWRSYSGTSFAAGTTGQALQLEAIRADISKSAYSGTISYKSHVQNVGWQQPVSDGALSGTVGRALRIEAIQFDLTGEIADHYDLYYRAHVENAGWLPWAKTGTAIGSTGLAYCVEAIEMRLVAKGSNAPDSQGGGYAAPLLQAGTVQYSAHLQGGQWQPERSNRELAGTVGQSKPLDGLKIQLAAGSGFSGGIQYRVHQSFLGWRPWQQNGEIAGLTSGSPIEAVEVRLTGSIANHFDVYYQSHISSVGWLGWAKNGRTSGSTGLSKRVEAIRIALVPKKMAAPGSTANALYRPRPDFTSANSLTVLVNKKNPLNPQNYVPANLVSASTYGVPVRGANGSLRSDAAAALGRMHRDAAAAGVPFSLVSGYRSYSTQAALFNSYAARDGVRAAERYSARPGYSEHQTGLAADLGLPGGSMSIGGTSTGRWLADNSWRYGFILRYPSGKTDVTGFIYEPWHFRYIGVEEATRYRNSGATTYEQYAGYPAAPTY